MAADEIRAKVFDEQWRFEIRDSKRLEFDNGRSVLCFGIA